MSTQYYSPGAWRAEEDAFMTEIKRLRRSLPANFRRSHGGVREAELDRLQELVDGRFPPSSTPPMLDEPGGELTLAMYGSSLAFVNLLKQHLVLMWAYWRSHGKTLRAELVHDLTAMIDERVAELEEERGEPMEIE